MSLVSVAHAKAGMMVTRDVVGRNDTLLIPSYTILTDTHLQVLKTWGVSNVEIFSTDKETEAADGLPVSFTAPDWKASTVIENRFRQANFSHPLIQALYRVCLNRLVQTQL